MLKLERAQNKALRIVTGQYSSTPVEALRLESGISSYKTHSKRLACIAAEKADRLPPDHPRNAALNPAVPVHHRSKTRSSWRETSRCIRNGLPTAGLPMEPLPSPFQKPWVSEGEPRRRLWKVFTSMPEPPQEPTPKPQAAENPFSAMFQDNPFWRVDHQDQVQAMTTNQTNAARAIKMIDSYEVDIVLYTDGSCKGGMEEGGAAVVVTTGTASNPVVLETIQKKGAKYTCSYQEEKEAMVEALKWMKVNQKYSDTVICSDSQSLLTSIDTMNPDTADLRAELDLLHGRTYLHWIPAHINIPGNEYADRAAKEAALLPDTDSPVAVSYGAAKSIIKQRIKDDEPSHPLVKETYNGYIRRKDKALKCRKDQSLIAQLRAGHCLMLSHYKNRIDDKKSPICPDCEEEEETVRHWLKCPAKIRTREDVFGRADVNPDTMNKDPQRILAYAEATLIRRNP
jgi:ribonuclease HI